MRLRVRGGEWDEVTPCGTADLERTSGGHFGSFQPEEMSDCSQVPRGGLWKRIRGVRSRVVVGAQPVDRIVEVAGGMRLVSRLSH